MPGTGPGIHTVYQMRGDGERGRNGEGGWEGKRKKGKRKGREGGKEGGGEGGREGEGEKSNLDFKPLRGSHGRQIPMNFSIFFGGRQAPSLCAGPCRPVTSELPTCVDILLLPCFMNG